MTSAPSTAQLNQISEVERPASRAPFRKTWWADVALAVIVGLVAVIIAAWALGVGLRSIGVPWGDGDMVTTYAFTENLRRGHWFLVNPDLGFPAFQDQGHFPVPDLLPIAMLTVLSHITPSAVAAANIFNLGTFFTVAAGTYLLLRWESVAKPFSAVIAIAFAVLPWHFVRSGGHVFLAGYVSVPAALFLVGLVARRNLEKPRSRWLFPMAIVAAIVVGSNGVYYSLMTTLLLGVVLLITTVYPRFSFPRWRTLLVCALVPLTTMVAVLVNRMSISTPSSGESIVRSPGEAYLYGGNLATLFFPATSTLSGKALGKVLNLNFPNNGTFEGDALLSSAAVLAVLLTCGVAALRWSTNVVRRRSVIGRASFWPGVFLFTTALFAMGGLGALFSAWVSNDIRAWGRFSVFVVGTAFLVTGIVLTAWRKSRRRALRVVAVVLGVAMAVSAVADLSVGGQRLPVDRGRALSAELTAYTSAVEQHLAKGCAVLELPLVPYPEYPAINRMSDYSHLWTYVYSDDLRWSYGAMKGTPLGEWGMDAADDPAQLLVRARAAGFCGIQVDTWAFANMSEGVDEQTAFGDPDIVSSSGRWAFFDLTGPLSGEYSVEPGAGFAVAAQTASLPVVWWMVEDTATLAVHGAPGAQVQVELDVSSAPCGPVTVTIDGSAVTVQGSQRQQVTVALDAQGLGSVSLATSSTACTVDGEAAPVFLGLGGPDWAPTVTESQP